MSGVCPRPCPPPPWHAGLCPSECGCGLIVTLLFQLGHASSGHVWGQSPAMAEEDACGTDGTHSSHLGSDPMLLGHVGSGGHAGSRAECAVARLGAARPTFESA